MLRSVLAVVAGFLWMSLLVIVILALVLILFHAAFARLVSESFPSTGLFMPELVLLYVCAVAGGYKTAHLARRAEILHGLALSALILVMSAVSISMGHGLKLSWSLIALLAVVAFGIYIGSSRRARHRGRIYVG